MKKQTTNETVKNWFFLWVFLSAFHAFSQSDYERAVRLFEEADSIRYAENNQLKKDNHNYRLAIQKFEEARDLFNNVDSLYYGFRCEVGVLKCKNRIDELDSKLIDKLVNRLIANGIEDSLLGKAYYYFGSAENDKFKFYEASLAFEKALELFRKFDMSIDYVNTAWFLGVVWYELNDPIRELKYYETALRFLKSRPSSKYTIRTRFLIRKNAFETYLTIGDYRSYWKSVEICKNLIHKYPKWFSNQDEVLLNSILSSGYLFSGNYEKAYDLILRQPELSTDLAISLGIILNDLGMFEERLSLYHSQLRKRDSHFYQAKFFNNIGTTYSSLRVFDSAEYYVRNALNINSSLGNEQGLGINLGNLGEILYQKGRQKEADSILIKALSYRSTNQTEIKRLLSKNYFKVRDYDNALKYAELAVFNNDGNLVEQFRGNPFRRKLEAYKWLLSLYARLNLVKGLDSFNDRSVELIEKVHHKISNTYSFFSDEILSLTGRLAFIYEYGINYCERRYEEMGDKSYSVKAFQLSEWSKVQALQRAKKTPNAKLLGGLPKEVLDLESQLKVHENFLKSQVSKSNDLEIDSAELARNRDKLFGIQQSQDSLENIIRINYPRYHQLRYQDITLSVEEVQERLRSSQAFIEYYEGDSTSFVFTITKEDYQVQRIHLDDDTLITRYREYFEPDRFDPAQQEVNQLSFQIYENYLQPALDNLSREIDELIVVPDGKLSYVPFDILLTKSLNAENDQVIPYLLRDYQVHYTYSASLYFNDFSTLSTKDEYLAFAPEYEATLTDTASINRLGTFRNQVTPLKHNQEEVAYIASQFKGLGYVGANANEKNFKEKVDEYGVLHLAMHTIVDDEDPMNSKLVFTNSKDSLEDDMLHAFEIYNMEIPSKLAVLSACETGFGQLAKGEGALSLARAFSYAGSPSVVMSHWPVDDQTTAVLMKSFYNYLSKGLSKSDALRRSKLDFLDQTHSARMHPFFWGSFVVMGDDSPIYIKRLPQVNPFLVLMGCLLVLCSAGFVLVRYEL